MLSEDSSSYFLLAEVYITWPAMEVSKDISLAIKNRNDDFELKELRHHDEVSLLKILSVLFWPD